MTKCIVIVQGGKFIRPELFGNFAIGFDEPNPLPITNYTLLITVLTVLSIYLHIIIGQVTSPGGSIFLSHFKINYNFNFLRRT